MVDAEASRARARVTEMVDAEPYGGAEAPAAFGSHRVARRRAADTKK